MNQIAIVILAAGNAKRMGLSKQLLPWGDSTLLGSAIKIIRSTDASKVFVVLGAYRDEIRKKVDLSETVVLVNENWQQGLGSSIALAVAALDEKYSDINAVLFTLADQPFIGNVHLNTIMKLHLKKQQAIIITRKEHYSGVPVLFPRKFFAELMLLSNDEGAKQIVTNNKNQVVEVLTQDETADIDTYETYEKLFQIHQKYPSDKY